MISKLKPFIPLALSLAFLLSLLSLVSLVSLSQSMALAQENGPTITAVSPSYGWNDEEVYLYIEGNGFESLTPTVTLNYTPLTIMSVNSEQIIAGVPLGMAAGLYSVTVEMANGMSDTKYSAFRLLEPSGIDDLTSSPEWLWTEPRTLHVNGQVGSGVGIDLQRLGGFKKNGVLKLVKVDFYLKTATGDELLGQVEVMFIDPESVVATPKVIWEPEEAGQYTICAIIDPDNEIEEINPEEPGGGEGNNEICGTINVLPEATDMTPPIVLQTPFQINDGEPTTADSLVRVNVEAVDPLPNPRSGIDALYFIEYDYGPNGWYPVKSSGWVPYSEAHENYLYSLQESYGIRYMRAWAVDRAGNISRDSAREDINLLTPPEQSGFLAEGEVDFYRILLQPGDVLSATLTPLSGDPDLYIWTPSGDLWYDGDLSATENVTAAAPELGTYQIEVRAYTTTEYRLSFEVTESARERLPNLRSPLSLNSISPPYGWNDEEVYLYIEGNGFEEPLTVTLNYTPLTVTSVYSDLLIAQVPLGMAPGLYRVNVETANGSDTKYDAYRVLQLSNKDDLTSSSDWLWTEPRTLRVNGPVNSGVGINLQRLGGSKDNGGVLELVKVDFYLRTPVGDNALGQAEVMFITPDTVVSTGKVIWEPEEAGEYMICAIIDPDNEIEEINPEESNGGEGNNEICRTITVLEQAADEIEPVVHDDFRINDGPPSTSELNVTFDVTAEDPPPNPRSGVNALYFIEFEYILGTGWVPVQRSGWIPYATAHQNYPWTLKDTYGIRYIRAWAVDKAGNISLDSRIGGINLLPSEQKAFVGEGQVDFYRILVQAGQTLSVTLTPVSGDPDLYIWGDSNNALWFSNNPLGVESFTIPMTETGTYQIEGHGYTDAEYRLSFEVTDDYEPQGLRASQANSDKELPTAPWVPISDVPLDVYVNPPTLPVSNNIYLPMMMSR